MKKLSIKKELQRLDAHLIYIASHKNYSVTEKEFNEQRFFNEEIIKFLLEKELILRTKIPVSYKLTEKGLIHIAYGGFVSKAKRKNLFSNIKLLYLVSYPIFAFLSLLISFFALFLSLKTYDNEKNYNHSHAITFKTRKYDTNNTNSVDSCKVFNMIFYGDSLVITKNIVHLADSAKYKDDSNK